jgi:hypothetical protein
MSSEDHDPCDLQHNQQQRCQQPLPRFRRSRGGLFDATIGAGILTALAGLFPVAGLLAIQTQRNALSLLCLLGLLGGMVYVPGLGVLCGWFAYVWFKHSSISPVRAAIVLALIADLWLLGWVALVRPLGV